MRIIIKAVKEERQAFIDYLAERLPHAEFCFDERRSCMDTFLRSLEMAGDDPCIHIEDDILLTKDFVSKANHVITRKPFSLIQFFSMRKKDITVGSRWDNDYLMNQCFYAPPTYSRLMREYADTWMDGFLSTNPHHSGGTDLMMKHFLKDRREKYWIHCPNLVDHRIAKSVIDPRRSSKRQSLTFTDCW